MSTYQQCKPGAALVAALTALAISTAACGSASIGGGGQAGGGGTTTSPPASSTTTPSTTTPGLIRVTILSHSGPYGGMDTALAATSLAQLRSESRCAGSSTCWSDAKAAGSDLLIAATVEACRSVVGASAAVRGGTTLFVTVLHEPGNGPATECTGTVPRLWLFGIPLASLPHHVTLRIEVQGGESTRPSVATTSVALP